MGSTENKQQSIWKKTFHSVNHFNSLKVLRKSGLEMKLGPKLHWNKRVRKLDFD